ncbi:SDR family oxidoreductase [Streptomyces sp. QH1-20]|uniref:SDR family oxidoreductase n=1 Tax=Streptomyces sp. QH1-20 TaxID=3240934 RepID=UPI00351262C4
MTRPRAVVITGCSSGIGRAVALRLLGRGYAVYATARSTEPLREFATAGAEVLPVDLTDQASMEECVRRVEKRHGAVWGLVNNAGYALAGPVEELDLRDIRQQFEVNVFGQLAMAQLVLPGMRRTGEGRIVNISSVAGRFTLPGAGCYHASKHALTSFSDALRFETRPFGVRVSTIEPGAVRTRFIATALRLLTAHEARDPVYTAFRDELAHCYRRVQRSPRRYGVGSPAGVARAVERALSARSPRSRYVVGTAARASLGLRRTLPGALFDALVRTQLPTPCPKR